MSILVNKTGVFYLTVLGDFINDFNDNMHALVKKEHEDATALKPSLYFTGFEFLDYQQLPAQCVCPLCTCDGHLTQGTNAEARLSQ